MNATDSELMRCWRSLVKLTQAQAGEALGMSKESVRSIEKGRRPLEKRTHLLMTHYFLHGSVPEWGVFASDPVELGKWHGN